MIPVYVIHLPNPERKAKIAAELARVGFTDITYVHAQEPVQTFKMSNMRRNPRGEFGCALSHLKALIIAAQVPRQTTALFVEDDVVFAPDFKPSMLFDVLAVTSYDSARGTGYPNYRVAYLGGHPRGPVTKVSDTLVRIGPWSCAEAYMMNYESIIGFLQFWCDRAGQPNAMYDFILGEYAAQGESYAFYPQLTHQPVGWSQIGQKIDDKSACVERGWKANLAA
jgi:hypothetical protein